MSAYGWSSPKGASAMEASGSASGGGGGALAAYMGVTRSRTLLFQSYRDSVPRSRRGKGSSPWNTSMADLSLDDDPYSEYGQHGVDEYGHYAGNGTRTYEANDHAKGKRRARGTYYDAAGELQGGKGDTFEEERSSYPPSRHHSLDMSTLPPRWVDTSDKVDQILDSLQSKIAHLDKLHTKHVLPGFTDRSQEEREIERETSEITREFRRCSKLIASLASNTKALANAGNVTAREIAMANNAQTALATRVQDASGAFRRKQTNYMQRLRGHEARHQDLHGSGMLIRDSETALQEDMELSRRYATKSIPQQEQTQLLLEEQEIQWPAADDATITQRDREIKQIARSISELAELFQDLSALVIDQGTMLDRIDFNIEHMGQDMHAAVRELNQATQYQKRTSRGQCILFLVLLIFLVITVIIVKPFWRLFFGP